jgi:RNA polymerase sigma-70 factor (ECF subfamily)
VCLDEIHARKRRLRPFQEGAPSNGSPAVEELFQRPAEYWVEPIAEDRALPSDPAERAILRESIRLAFVAALQVLPAKQRAAFLLVDVLDFSAQEAADVLDATVAAINSALQRARAAMEEFRIRTPELREPSRDTLERFVSAFESFDIDALTAMLREDANFSMPPYAMWLRGPEAVRTWLSGLGSGCRGSRLIATTASGLPAFAQYRPNAEGGHSPWALIVLEYSDDRVVGWTSFMDVARLFPAFGMASALPRR